MKIIPVFLLAPALFGGTITLETHTTETQISVSYTATTSAFCAITVVPGTSNLPAYDVNPSLFTNANQDLQRTFANGFRWPTLVSGLRRTVFLGGHDEIKKTLLGTSVSTAYETNAVYAITIACNSGTDVGTATVITETVKYGSYYPETFIPDPSQAMLGVQPTINWTDRTVKYADPITGVLMQRISSPTDNFADAWNPPIVWGSPVIDLDSAWTNPQNATTFQASGTLATTSTQNARLFLPFDSTFQPPGALSNNADYFTDISIVPYGSASSTSVTAGWGISKDSGQTIDNFTAIPTTYGTSAIPYAAIPSNFPGPYFSGWGGMKTSMGMYDITNYTCSKCVSASSTTVTLNTPTATGFNIDRVANSKFKLTNCDSGSPAPYYTRAAVVNAANITTVETGLSLTNCDYTDLSVGIMVQLTSAGTINLSASGVAGEVRSATAGSNGARWVCALSPVTNISTDCDGGSQSPPLTGYLCGLAQGSTNASIYVIQSNGRACLQSNLYDHTDSAHLQSLISGLVPFVSNVAYIGLDFQSPQHLWRGTHGSNYTEMAPCPQHNCNDNFSYTDLGTIASGIQAQIIAAGGPVADALNTGLWGTMNIDTIGDDGAGNSIIQYSKFAADSGVCMYAWANASNTLISQATLFGPYPFKNSACHASGQLAAGYTVASVQSTASQLGPASFNTGSLLGGPFVSKGPNLRKQGSYGTWTISISGCTKATTMVCTSANNDLDNMPNATATLGAFVTIAGATGTGWTTINTGLYAHKLTNSTFSLYTDPQGSVPVNSSGFGTLGGTVTASMMPPMYSVPIGSVIGTTGPTTGGARIVPNLTTGFLTYFPSGNLPVRDGDPITITPTYLNSTTQYYAKVTGAPAGDFDVYSDAALMTQVPWMTLSGAGGWFATLAEACPDPATVSLPGPMYMDTGFGTTGGGNQKIRCLTAQFNNQPESDFPSAGEHVAYPPPASSSEAGNTAKSMLHQMAVGDSFTNMSVFPGANHEVLYILAIDSSGGQNNLKVTLMRDYGDDPNYGWRGVTNGPGDTYSLQWSAGWTPWAGNAIPSGLIYVNNSPVSYAIPPVNGDHSDTVPGTTPTYLTQASGWQSNVPDSKVNLPISTFTGPLTMTHNSTPFWSSTSTNTFALTVPNQTYPSKRQVPGQAPASEFGWNADWMAMNIFNGNPQNTGDGNFDTRTISLAAGTTKVWFLPITGGTPNIKIGPLLVSAFPHFFPIDISSAATGNVITDSTANSACFPLNNNECRTGSTALSGVYFTGSVGNDFFGQVIFNDATIGPWAAFGLWPGAGWAVQVREVPLDTSQVGARRLTLGWTLPSRHYSFSNWIPTPDAKYGLFAGNPIQQRPNRKLYSGSQWFAMKLPPTPPNDSAVRTTFIPFPLTGKCATGETFRAAFGYGENGNPASLYGTTRQETTWTSSSPSATNPFLFDGESQSPVSCSANAFTVNIPAIPGRVLFYQLERTTSSVARRGALSSAMVP